jgi:hypothetical protein
MRVKVQTGSKWSAAVPERLFQGGFNFYSTGTATATYDVQSNGRRFLMIRPRRGTVAAGSASIVVVQNWLHELSGQLVSKQ